MKSLFKTDHQRNIKGTEVEYLKTGETLNNEGKKLARRNDGIVDK